MVLPARFALRFRLPILLQLRETGELMSNKSVSWMKNFAKVGGIFSAVECVVEKTRGKHDIQNAVLSGCIAGAGLAYKQGAAAMAMGCGGFAAFSLVIGESCQPTLRMLLLHPLLFPQIW